LRMKNAAPTARLQRYSIAQQWRLRPLAMAWRLNDPKGRFFVKAFKKTCFLMPWSAGKEKKGDEAYLAVRIRVSGALYQR